MTENNSPAKSNENTKSDTKTVENQGNISINTQSPLSMYRLKLRGIEDPSTMTLHMLHNDPHKIPLPASGKVPIYSWTYDYASLLGDSALQHLGLIPGEILNCALLTPASMALPLPINQQSFDQLSLREKSNLLTRVREKSYANHRDNLVPPYFLVMRRQSGATPLSIDSQTLPESENRLILLYDHDPKSCLTNNQQDLVREIYRYEHSLTKTEWAERQKLKKATSHPELRQAAKNVLMVEWKAGSKNPKVLDAYLDLFDAESVATKPRFLSEYAKLLRVNSPVIYSLLTSGLNPYSFDELLSHFIDWLEDTKEYAEMKEAIVARQSSINPLSADQMDMQILKITREILQQYRQQPILCPQQFTQIIIRIEKTTNVPLHLIKYIILTFGVEHPQSRSIIQQCEDRLKELLTRGVDLWEEFGRLCTRQCYGTKDVVDFKTKTRHQFPEGNSKPYDKSQIIRPILPEGDNLGLKFEFLHNQWSEQLNKLIGPKDQARYLENYRNPHAALNLFRNIFYSFDEFFKQHKGVIPPEYSGIQQLVDFFILGTLPPILKQPLAPRTNQFSDQLHQLYRLYLGVQWAYARLTEYQGQQSFEDNAVKFIESLMGIRRDEIRRAIYGGSGGAYPPLPKHFNTHSVSNTAKIMAVSEVCTSDSPSQMKVISSDALPTTSIFAQKVENPSEDTEEKEKIDDNKIQKSVSNIYAFASSMGIPEKTETRPTPIEQNRVPIYFSKEYRTFQTNFNSIFRVHSPPLDEKGKPFTDKKEEMKSCSRNALYSQISTYIQDDTNWKKFENYVGYSGIKKQWVVELLSNTSNDTRKKVSTWAHQYMNLRRGFFHPISFSKLYQSLLEGVVAQFTYKYAENVQGFLITNQLGKSLSDEDWDYAPTRTYPKIRLIKFKECLKELIGLEESDDKKLGRLGQAIQNFWNQIKTSYYSEMKNYPVNATISSKLKSQNGRIYFRLKRQLESIGSQLQYKLKRLFEMRPFSDMAEMIPIKQKELDRNRSKIMIFIESRRKTSLQKPVAIMPTELCDTDFANNVRWQLNKILVLFENMTDPQSKFTSLPTIINSFDYEQEFLDVEMKGTLGVFRKLLTKNPIIEKNQEISIERENSSKEQSDSDDSVIKPSSSLEIPIDKDEEITSPTKEPTEGDSETGDNTEEESSSDDSTIDSTPFRLGEVQLIKDTLPELLKSLLTTAKDKEQIEPSNIPFNLSTFVWPAIYVNLRQSVFSIIAQLNCPQIFPIDYFHFVTFSHIYEELIKSHKQLSDYISKSADMHSRLLELDQQFQDTWLTLWDTNNMNFNLKANFHKQSFPSQPLYLDPGFSYEKVGVWFRDFGGIMKKLMHKLVQLQDPALDPDGNFLKTITATLPDYIKLTRKFPEILTRLKDFEKKPLGALDLDSAIFNRKDPQEWLKPFVFNDANRQFTDGITNISRLLLVDIVENVLTSLEMTFKTPIPESGKTFKEKYLSKKQETLRTEIESMRKTAVSKIKEVQIELESIKSLSNDDKNKLTPSKRYRISFNSTIGNPFGLPLRKLDDKSKPDPREQVYFNRIIKIIRTEQKMYLFCSQIRSIKSRIKQKTKDRIVWPIIDPKFLSQWERYPLKKTWTAPSTQRKIWSPLNSFSNFEKCFNDPTLWSMLAGRVCVQKEHKFSFDPQDILQVVQQWFSITKNQPKIVTAQINSARLRFKLVQKICSKRSINCASQDQIRLAHDKLKKDLQTYKNYCSLKKECELSSPNITLGSKCLQNFENSFTIIINQLEEFEEMMSEVDPDSMTKANQEDYEKQKEEYEQKIQKMNNDQPLKTFMTLCDQLLKSPPKSRINYFQIFAHKLPLFAKPTDIIYQEQVMVDTLKRNRSKPKKSGSKEKDGDDKEEVEKFRKKVNDHIYIYENKIENTPTSYYFLYTLAPIEGSRLLLGRSLNGFASKKYEYYRQLSEYFANRLNKSKILNIDDNSFVYDLNAIWKNFLHNFEILYDNIELWKSSGENLFNVKFKDLRDEEIVLQNITNIVIQYKSALEGLNSTFSESKECGIINDLSSFLEENNPLKEKQIRISKFLNEMAKPTEIVNKELKNHVRQLVYFITYLFDIMNAQIFKIMESIDKDRIRAGKEPILNENHPLKENLAIIMKNLNPSTFEKRQCEEIKSEMMDFLESEFKTIIKLYSSFNLESASEAKYRIDLTGLFRFGPVLFGNKGQFLVRQPWMVTQCQPKPYYPELIAIGNDFGIRDLDSVGTVYRDNISRKWKKKESMTESTTLSVMQNHAGQHTSLSLDLQRDEKGRFDLDIQRSKNPKLNPTELFCKKSKDSSKAIQEATDNMNLANYLANYTIHHTLQLQRRAERYDRDQAHYQEYLNTDSTRCRSLLRGKGKNVSRKDAMRQKQTNRNRSLSHFMARRIIQYAQAMLPEYTLDNYSPTNLAQILQILFARSHEEQEWTRRLTNTQIIHLMTVLKFEDLSGFRIHSGEPTSFQKANWLRSIPQYVEEAARLLGFKINRKVPAAYTSKIAFETGREGEKGYLVRWTNSLEISEKDRVDKVKYEIILSPNSPKPREIFLNQEKITLWKFPTIPAMVDQKIKKMLIGLKKNKTDWIFIASNSGNLLQYEKDSILVITGRDPNANGNIGAYDEFLRSVLVWQLALERVNQDAPRRRHNQQVIRSRVKWMLSKLICIYEYSQGELKYKNLYMTYLQAANLGEIVQLLGRSMEYLLPIPRGKEKQYNFDTWKNHVINVWKRQFTSSNWELERQMMWEWVKIDHSKNNMKEIPRLIQTNIKNIRDLFFRLNIDLEKEELIYTKQNRKWIQPIITLCNKILADN